MGTNTEHVCKILLFIIHECLVFQESYISQTFFTSRTLCWAGLPFVSCEPGNPVIALLMSHDITRSGFPQKPYISTYTTDRSQSYLSIECCVGFNIELSADVVNMGTWDFFWWLNTYCSKVYLPPVHITCCNVELVTFIIFSLFVAKAMR